MKGLEDWLDLTTTDLDPQSPPSVCDSCRKNGIPKIPVFALSPAKTLAMREITDPHADPKTAILRASRASGLKQSTIKNMLAGRGDPKFRRAYQVYLDGVGLGPEGIAKIMGESAKATEFKWNKADQVFDEFPDHRTRLSTAIAAAKQLDIDGLKSAGGAHHVQAIVINHNLGDGKEIDAPGTMSIQVDREVIDVGRQTTETP